jgi:hypothetical protein
MVGCISGWCVLGHRHHAAVGNGGLYPKVQGRLIGIVVMLVGIRFLSLLTGEITTRSSGSSANWRSSAPVSPDSVSRTSTALPSRVM